MRTTFFTTGLHSDLWRQMDRLLDDSNEFAPEFEVAEREDHFAISVDLPGMRKEDIKIEVLDRTLTLSGERRRFEKSYGTFKRTFMLPNTVNAEKIEANYEDGVLLLYVPKTQVAQARAIEIQSGKSSSLIEKFLGTKRTAQDATPVTQAN